MELGTWFPAEVLRLTISDTSGYTRGMLELAVKPLPDIFNLDYSRVELLPCYYLLLMMVTVIYIVACVGGRGTLWGSILAGFFLIGFQEYFRGLGAWHLVMYGVLLISVMIYAPKGLSSIKKHIW